MLALVVVETVVVALLAVLVVGLLRSHGEVLRRLHELGAGVYEPTSAPDRGGRAPTGRRLRAATRAVANDLNGVSPTGSAVAVAVSGVRHSTLLAFLSSGCSSCAGFWEAFANGGARDLGPYTRLVAVTRGPEAESPSAVAAVAPGDVVTVMSTEAFRDYGVPGGPHFVLVDGPSGTVAGEGSAPLWEEVVALLQRAVADASFAADDVAGADVADADGHTTDRGGPRHGGAGHDRAHLNGTERATRADAELAAAGIYPGDPSLYPGRPQQGAVTGERDGMDEAR